MSTCTQKLPAEYSVFNVKANRRVYKVYVDQHERDQAYIAELERVLKELNVSIPEVIPEAKRITDQIVPNHAVEHGLMKDGSLAALAKSMEWLKEHTHSFEINVQYTNLTFWNSLPAATIPTVGSAMKSLLFGGGPTRKVHIFKELTGRILPQKMTLLMGPPGCGEPNDILLAFFEYVQTN